MFPSDRDSGRRLVSGGVRLWQVSRRGPLVSGWNGGCYCEH
jgi:hypothetical protein